MKEGLLLRIQQRQRQPPSSPPFAGNAMTIISPSPLSQETVLRSPRHRDGTHTRNAIGNYGYQPPSRKSYIAAKVGRPLQKLPKGEIGGSRINQSPATRTTLPNGQPTPSQSKTTRERQLRQHRQDHTLSSQPQKKPSWMDGPVAMSGSRR